MQPLKSYLLSHPQSVGETYLQHMIFALGIAASLGLAAAAAAVHAVLPCLCERTASRKIERLHARMHNRGH